MLSGELLDKKRKEYHGAGIAMFVMTAVALAARIIVGMFEQYIESELVLDTIFSMIAQVGVFLILPFCIYKLFLKKNTREVLSFSNVKKPRAVHMAIVVPLVICEYIFAIGLNLIWLTILLGMGFTPSGAAPLPDTFSIGAFLLTIFISCVLPAVCEEFLMRGGFLTAITSAFKRSTAIFIMAIAFGLFHQSIQQFLYTAFFGGIVAFMVIRFRSIFLGVLMHFLSNFLVTYLEFASTYGWWLGNFSETMSTMILNNTAAAMGIWALFGIMLFTLLYLMVKIERGYEQKAAAKNISEMYDGEHGGGEEKLIFHEGSVHSPSGGQVRRLTGGFREDLFKPDVKDNIFYIGALVVTILSNIFTFIFGLFR